MSNRICQASYAKGYLDAKQEVKKQMGVLLRADGNLEDALQQTSPRVRTRVWRGKQLLSRNEELWRGPKDWMESHRLSAGIITGLALCIVLQQVVGVLVFGLGVATGIAVTYSLVRRSMNRANKVR